MNKKIDPNNLIWKREYNIQDYKIDLEHQSLFKLAKKALMIRTMDHDINEIKELKSVLKSLSNYVKTHFQNEEEYMKSIDYPDISRHKKLHKDLLEILNNLMHSFNDLTLDKIEETLYEFFEKYFLLHIINEDIDIGTWLRPLNVLRRNGKWNIDYTTGLAFLDKEHQKVFEILDEAFEEVEDKERNKKIKKVLTRLYSFMKEHFKKEERFMREINYSEIEEHKEIHQHIIKVCNTLLTEINETNSVLFEKKLAQFIDEHVINHILIDDKKITNIKER